VGPVGTPDAHVLGMTTAMLNHTRPEGHLRQQMAVSGRWADPPVADLADAEVG